MTPEQKMTPDQKEQWDFTQELEKDLVEGAKKDCDVPITCQVCKELIGYCDNDITMENLFVCVNCVEDE